MKKRIELKLNSDLEKKIVDDANKIGISRVAKIIIILDEYYKETK